MPTVRLLPKEVSELIAAGEVVERPASVIKELTENAIDAGATKLTVEIKNGGVTFMRITDNGCGIYPSDVPVAFLRHATSKVQTAEDLAAISTLGFRGEALASVAAVARVEMLTKPHEIDMGTRYRIEGGEEKLIEEAGCPSGTVLTVADLFFNTPARMKFLKKDVSEGNAVAAVMDRIALSHPEIAVRFIRDGKTTLSTPGNGNLPDTVYAVCGKEFASSMMPVKGEWEGIGVEGLTCKPIACRPTKNSQYVFLNGRFVKSGTVSAALDQAYKHSAMVGKFPSAVLCLTVPYGAVDVNVHPAKTEVRFSDEKRIFDAVYYAVKNALATGDTRPQMSLADKCRAAAFSTMTVEQYKQQSFAEHEKQTGSSSAARPTVLASRTVPPRPPQTEAAAVPSSFNQPKPAQKPTEEKAAEEKPPLSLPTDRPEPITEKMTWNPPLTEEQKAREEESIPPHEFLKEQGRDYSWKEAEPEEEIRVLGEAFATYIVAEKQGELWFIDKHAAHERLLYEDLRAHATETKQYLLAPYSATLSKEDYDAVISAERELDKMGFEVEDFGNGTVLVRAVPSLLVRENIGCMMAEIAESLRTKGKAGVERMEDIYHRIACRAAVKAHNVTTEPERLALAKRILSNRDIMYCPHGRPVAVKLTKTELEKQFGRIQ